MTVWDFVFGGLSFAVGSLLFIGLFFVVQNSRLRSIRILVTWPFQRCGDRVYSGHIGIETDNYLAFTR